MENKSTKLTALLLALVLVTSCFVGGTLARYVTSTSSEDSARVAVWGINDDGVTMDLFDGSYTVNGVLVANSQDGDNIIAPGTQKDNYFSIVNTHVTLKPEVMYEIAINLDDSEIDPLILNNPSIVWRLDEGEYGTWEETKAKILALSGDPSGVKTYAPLDVEHEFANGKTHKIGWKWIMDNNNNVMDTEMGNKAATDGDISAKISITITATQVNVDTTGMLNGNGQVYDINNPTPLVFRSAAPMNELQKVIVNNEEIRKNIDYTVSEGSTVITLTESFLETLDSGNYTTSIISENMTANATFAVVETDEVVVEDINLLIHNGTIPVGGTYYVEVNGSLEDNYIYDLEDLSSATAIYREGEPFPTPTYGDVYVYRDYMYKFEFIPDYGTFMNNEGSNKWGVIYIGNSTTTEEVIHSINGNTITDLTMTYCDSTLEIAPPIPTHVTVMSSAFEGSSNLTTIELNHVPENYSWMLKGTNVTEIGGSISEEEKNIMIENDVFGF